ncbi:hypothetical protein M501DRAFT_935823 [Patellaria atrata CBS 101060]|uniref:Uncharacterized protein n=1 Tax=Patellaria atrata CBS 101060 TaxID=1346257 RepID=A0A9P4VNX9_9PEZI|nr:hypothetical protein M501DRAFT_935823 [Patellaria atrata CBS 101060]
MSQPPSYDYELEGSTDHTNHIDEELPDYEPANVPGYLDRQASNASSRPLFSLHLLQHDSRLQRLVYFGPSNGDTYKVAFRGSMNLFSRKPDMNLIRISTGSEQTVVASISFVKDGPLPYYPRAKVVRKTPETVNEETTPMESRNFEHWCFNIDEITYVWFVSYDPMSLMLADRTGTVSVAQFTYSSVGIAAAKGAEIGELSILDPQFAFNRDLVELVISSCLVAINHFKNLGRHYRAGKSRAARGSETRTDTPSVLFTTARSNSLQTTG